MTAPHPHWRSFLRDWADAAAEHEAILSHLSARRASTRAEGLPAPRELGRLGGLRGPIRWLCDPPAQLTTDGSVVARYARRSWGRDGVWLFVPRCNVGSGLWALEQWTRRHGWIRTPAVSAGWLRLAQAKAGEPDISWRRCGSEILLPARVASRPIRAALVRWCATEADVRGAGIGAPDLLPLLESRDVGTRDGALQALAWARTQSDVPARGTADH